MLDREGKLLDVEEVGVTQQSVDIDAQGMCGKFGVEART